MVKIMCNIYIPLWLLISKMRRDEVKGPGSCAGSNCSWQLRWTLYLWLPHASGASGPLDGVAHTLPRTHRTLGKPWQSWGSLLYMFTRSTSLDLLNWS